VLQLTAVVGIVAAAARGGPKGESLPLFGESGPFYLVALIPLISFSLAHLWMDHDGWIDRIGEHIREKIETGRAMSWQTMLFTLDRTRTARDWGRYGFVLSYWCVFVLPGIFALVGLAEDASDALKWATVAVGAVFMVGNTAEWLIRVGWRRSKGGAHSL